MVNGETNSLVYTCIMVNYETNSLVLQMAAEWMIGEFRRVHSSTTTAH